MILETLYKRTKTGAVQEWTIQALAGIILKQAGQTGGKLTLHKETCSPKNIGRANETTAVEQSELQAQSDWKRKHDEGYKTLEDIAIAHGYVVDENFWEEYTTEQILAQLPQFNTDASGEVKPQLAPSKGWVAGPKNKYPKIAEVKFDGNRSLVKLTPEETTFLSRSGKPITTMGHLVEVLDAVFPKHLRERTKILDGEIYLHGLTLEEVNEAVKKPNENTPKMEFWVYDLPLNPGSQVVRSGLVAQLVAMIGSPFLRHHIGTIVNSDEDVQKLHDSMVAEGFEGLILKDELGTYQPGQRSNFWEKVKMMEDHEFITIGYELGSRGVQDLIFECRSLGGNFKVLMNGTTESKQKLYDNIDILIGQPLTVQHFGFSKYNIPNLPKGKCFRGDE